MDLSAFDIVQRLKRIIRTHVMADGLCWEGDASVCEEAAGYITSLRTRITALERELAEAREALKPFKDRLFDRTTFEEALYGKKYWAADSVEIYVPIGDLRRAARAYNSEKPGNP